MNLQDLQRELKDVQTQLGESGKSRGILKKELDRRVEEVSALEREVEELQGELDESDKELLRLADIIDVRVTPFCF